MALGGGLWLLRRLSLVTVLAEIADAAVLRGSRNSGGRCAGLSPRSTRLSSAPMISTDRQAVLPFVLVTRLRPVADELAELSGLERVSQHRGSGVGGVQNEVSGTVAGPVVQAGTIHGGIHIHPKSHDHVVPRQLPAAPGRVFIGRAAELDTLTAALDSTGDEGSTMVISAIGGMGGIGKTWLAVQWAHQHADRFPDGQLFVELHGFDPSGEPTSPEVAVRGCLEALGVDPAVIPVGLDAQVGLYRSVVAGRRLLIVLDNAHDTSQVVPLLPGSSTCTVVVTSRDRLAGLVTAHCARPVTVDVLDEPASRALFARRIDPQRLATEPNAVAELVNSCAGLPLALSIVAGRAMLHPQIPLRVLAAELQDNATRLTALDVGDPAGNLRAVLSWSYSALAREDAQVFGLLGLTPGPDISRAATASLTALPPDRLTDTLRTLECGSLIQQQAPGRYRMHDLVRLYAADQAHHDIAENHRTAALRRVVDFYVHTGARADVLLDPHRGERIDFDSPTTGCHPHAPADRAEALAWFSAEHPSMRAAQQVATDHGWHPAVWQLARILTTYHTLRGYFHDDLASWQIAFTAANHSGTPTILSLAHRFLGDAHMRIGHLPEALSYQRQALTLAENDGNIEQQASTHNRLSMVWEVLADHQQALDHAIRGQDLTRNLGNPVLNARALANVGWSRAQLGHYDEARVDCETADTLLRDLHDTGGGLAANLDSLGYIARQTGQYDQALRYYQEAITLNRETGDVYSEADTLDMLGHIHATLGHHDQARDAWQQALTLYRSQHRTDDADRIQQQLANSDNLHKT